MLVIKPDEGCIYTIRLGSSMVRNDITTLAFMGNSGTWFGNNIVSTQWLVTALVGYPQQARKSFWVQARFPLSHLYR